MITKTKNTLNLDLDLAVVSTSIAGAHRRRQNCWSNNFCFFLCWCTYRSRPNLILIIKASYWKPLKNNVQLNFSWPRHQKQRDR